MITRYSIMMFVIILSPIFKWWYKVVSGARNESV